MQETKEGFLGEVPMDLQDLCKIMEFRYAEIGIFTRWRKLQKQQQEME